MGLLDKFSTQFGNPKGFWGNIAGKLMAKGIEKNEWTISLLNIQKTNNVLEIGFGPGVAVELVSNIVSVGHIVGIDISEVMLHQATKRNLEAIKEGRIDLKLINISTLPLFETKFDKIFSVNTIFFWSNPVEILKHIRKFMNENGTIALTVQPPGGTDETAKDYGKQIITYFNQAGFSNIRMETKTMKPVASVCVIGSNK